MAFAALGDGDKANELFSILNPINRASTRAGVHRYKVEPYVAAADVYAESPHVGRVVSQFVKLRHYRRPGRMDMVHGLG